MLLIDIEAAVFWVRREVSAARRPSIPRAAHALPDLIVNGSVRSEDVLDRIRSPSSSEVR